MMSRKQMSSRERMLAAIESREPDHVPCSFMLYGALKSRTASYLEFIDRQMAMGLDTVIEIPPRQPVVVNDYYNLHGMPVHPGPDVLIEEWIERPPDEEVPVLVKEYKTPDGVLRAEVRKTHDWRWGDHVPFFDDYIIPRSKKFLVGGPEDLRALSHLLAAPTDDDVQAFRAASAPALDAAHERGLLVAGGWGVGADAIGWICGLQNMIFMVYDNPELMRALLRLISDWNRTRMQVILDAGIDLYTKRAWYENLDFWTPATWKEFLSPILRAEVDLAHERGARFGYIITSNCMQLLDPIAEAGVDVLIGVDPHSWDLESAKAQVAGRVCLWGGVNGHLTVEGGSQDDVRTEVRRAMTVLALGGGFILSPVDNVREDTPLSRANVDALIDEWRLLADAPGTS
jgi:hypothetical protein